MFSVYHINFHFDSLFSCPLFTSSFPMCSASLIPCNFTPPSLSSKHRRPTALFIVSLTTSLPPSHGRSTQPYLRSLLRHSFSYFFRRFGLTSTSHALDGSMFILLSSFVFRLSPPRFFVPSESTYPHALGLAFLSPL